jgi:Na+/H+ antiporter NhaC
LAYGLWSLLPPMLAIVLAIATRRIVAPLALAVFCGAAILNYDPSSLPRWGLQSSVGAVTSVWDSITNFDRRRAVAFSLLLGAMVGVLEAGGGMRALIARLAKNIRTRRGGQTLITTLGLSIFFDDYANSLLVGGTMRTTADRFGISRAKLAYLVDSTSAPVAGLAPVSTWVVAEISFVAAGLTLAAVSSDVSAFSVFMASMPYRFYAILALVMVFAIAISDRDFGPMRRSQSGDSSKAEPFADALVAEQPAAPVPEKLGWAAVVPVFACVTVVVASLYFSGRGGVPEQTRGFIQTAGAIISHGDSYQALINGGATGLLLAIVLHRLIGRVDWRILGRGVIRGAMQMLPAMVILWFAWTLSDQTKRDQLDSGGYLGHLISDQISAFFLPTVVFIVAAAVAFSTGTSWGTMAILTPMSVELAMKIGPLDAAGIADPFSHITVATVGAVLAGAIFGDHCSPISDTTVLSSRACGCDHVTHVRTQLPYAVSVGAISIVCGTMPAAWGVSPYLCLAMGTAAIITMVYLLGERPEQLQPVNDLVRDDLPAT